MCSCEGQEPAARSGGLMIALVVLGAAVAQGQPLAEARLKEVRLEQRLEEAVPLDARFVDERGDTVRLGAYFRGQPVVLVPVFYKCPMLCTQVLNALIRALNDVPFAAGRDFEVVVFTIDPRETPTLAAEKKLEYLRRYDHAEANRGWHFLTGEEGAIRRVTDALGYHYVYDERTDQFAHPAAVALITPEGRIGRYLMGLDYSAQDMRLALVETGEGKIGSLADQILLRCYAYDPTKGRYGFAIMTALRVGGLMTIAGVAGLVALMRRRRGAGDGEPGRGEATCPRQLGHGTRRERGHGSPHEPRGVEETADA